MSYSTCIKGGGLCTGCMACQERHRTEEREENYLSRIDEVLEWFGSSWECLLAIIENCELFAEDNEEFVRVKKVVEGDELTIYWDDGVEFYPKEDVEEWTSSDFANYLGLYDGDAFISVMEKEKFELRKEK